MTRKKSMSLERMPEPHNEKKAQPHPPKQNQQQQQHNPHVDLLSADHDLLGGHDDFGDFKQAQSASPIKKQDHFNIKAHSEQEIQQQGQNQQWNWNFNAGQNQGQAQNNTNNQSPPQNVQQQPAENKVDFMKLYNQPQMNQVQGHQNHFMQMQQGGGMQGGWNAHQNNGWHSAGHYGMQQQQHQQQFQGGFPQQQGFQNNANANMGNMGGFNNNANAGFNQNMGYGMGGGMGMQQNMGYGQQGQFNNTANAFPNQGYAQMSGNRFF